MNPLYVGLLLGLMAVVMPLVAKVLKEKRGGSEKYQKIMEDFRAQVQRELKEGETVEAMCGYIPCAAVTNMRLLVSSRDGLVTVPFAEIRSLSGMNGGGNKTSDPDKMLAFTIKAKKKYVLGNHSEGFDQVVLCLYRHTGCR